jgi:CubicO group peptidase (beta-lactamase class C family)
MSTQVNDQKLSHLEGLLSSIVKEDGGAGSSFSLRRDGELLFSSAQGTSKKDGNALTRDTLLPIFSGTKGLLAGVIAVLADRGDVNYSDNLSKYWAPAARWTNPDLTVAMVLSHRAGLPHIDPHTEVLDLWNTELMLERLARTEQLFPAGTRMAYHWLTYGWFAHVIVKAATGLSAGQALREIITTPLEIDAYLGVPKSELARCGAIERAENYRTNVFLKPNNLYAERTYGNPILLAGKGIPWNDPELMQKELPGGGAWASADAMSKYYQFTLDPSFKPAWTPQFTDIDAATDRPISMSMGFERDDSINSYGPIVPAFGHTGAGGSIHGCWPETGISFSFATTLMRTDQEDQRGKSLLKATAAALL